MLNDTLLGFQTLAETAAEKSLVVWINEYFGEIERDGKTFDQMQVFLDNREKVLTSIGVPQRSPDLYGSDIRHMRERKLTFDEAISVDLDFNIVEKWRLNRVRRELSNNWRKRRSREVPMPNSQTPPLVNASFAREELPLSVRDAAVYLGVSPQTVYLWVERKQIPHLRVMGRNIRFLKSELEPFRAQFKQEIGNGKT
jgi:excisionase family DNA binding protein